VVFVLLDFLLAWRSVVTSSIQRIILNVRVSEIWLGISIAVLSRDFDDMILLDIEQIIILGVVFGQSKWIVLEALRRPH